MENYLSISFLFSFPHMMINNVVVEGDVFDIYVSKIHPPAVQHSLPTINIHIEVESISQSSPHV